MLVKTTGIDDQIVNGGIDVYTVGLKATAKIFSKHGMVGGAVAITLGHILKLYKGESLNTPKTETAVLTNVQEFDRLAEAATGFAHSTLLRYMQLASAFLIKKHHIQKLIEDNVKGMTVNEQAVDKIVKEIGEELEVTALYRKYGILPQSKDKHGGGKPKSLKDVIVDEIENLVAWFGQKADAEGYDAGVIVSIQNDLTAIQSKAEKSLADEEIKAIAAKENRNRIVTKKKTKLVRELDKAMELHEAEMKASQGPPVQKSAGAAA